MAKSKKRIKILAANLVGKYGLSYSIDEVVEMESKQADELIDARDAKEYSKETEAKEKKEAEEAVKETEAKEKKEAEEAVKEKDDSEEKSKS